MMPIDAGFADDRTPPPAACLRCSDVGSMPEVREANNAADVPPTSVSGVLLHRLRPCLGHLRSTAMRPVSGGAPSHRLATSLLRVGTRGEQGRLAEGRSDLVGSS